VDVFVCGRGLDIRRHTQPSTKCWFGMYCPWASQTHMRNSRHTQSYGTCLCYNACVLVQGASNTTQGVRQCVKRYVCMCECRHASHQRCGRDRRGGGGGIHPRKGECRTRVGQSCVHQDVGPVQDACHAQAHQRTEVSKGRISTPANPKPTCPHGVRHMRPFSCRPPQHS
jgi:hypothetical protein